MAPKSKSKNIKIVLNRKEVEDYLKIEKIRVSSKPYPPKTKRTPNVAEAMTRRKMPPRNCKAATNDSTQLRQADSTKNIDGNNIY